MEIRESVQAGDRNGVQSMLRSKSRETQHYCAKQIFIIALIN